MHVFSFNARCRVTWLCGQLADGLIFERTMSSCDIVISRA